MNSISPLHNQEHQDELFLYLLRALPSSEHAAVELQAGECADCRQELETLRPIVHSFAGWPTDVLRPSVSLWDRLSQRIAQETGTEPVRVPSESRPCAEWETAAPGISVKLLATDTEKSRVSMLVRLAPGADYPPHRHAGEEELHLLHGELMIDEKKLYPGDYIRAKAGTMDHRVWSETGCTCVLLTSTRDELL